jgi:type I restriction enzyme M protein
MIYSQAAHVADENPRAHRLFQRGRRGCRRGPSACPRPAPQKTRQVSSPAVLSTVRALLVAAKPLPGKSSLLWLLFFKRVCDRLEEEREASGAQPARDVPAAHRLIVPGGSSWRDVRRHSEDIGAALKAAFRSLEEANPQLAGLLSFLDLSDRKSFPPAILQAVFERLDSIPMRGSDMDEDSLGEICDALMQEAAEGAGRSKPIPRTPRPVAHLLVELLQPQEGMSIYDGACGTGGLLLECGRHLKRLGRNHESLRLYGQEIEPESWALCRVSFACLGIPSDSIERGDTLRSPRHLAGDGKALQTFDRVITHPPFDLGEWGFEEWSPADRYGRSEYGLPPRSCGDFAFLEHSLSSLNSRGMLGLVAPQGVLTRQREEGEIRRRMLQDDLVEAVVTIGRGVLSRSSAPACVLIVNRAKPPEHRGKVLLVNGHAGTAAGASEGGLSNEAVDRISAAFRSWKDQEGFCCVISREEIERDGAVLGVEPRVPAGTEGGRDGVMDEWRTLRKLIEETNEAEQAMAEIVHRLELDSMTPETIRLESLGEPPGDAQAGAIDAVDGFVAASEKARDQAGALAGRIRRRLLAAGIRRSPTRPSPIGDVPVSWEVKSVGEIARFSSGKTKPKDAFRVPSPSRSVPIFSGKGLLGYSGNCLRNGATIVVGRVGTHCGSVHYVSDPACWITDAALFVYETRPEVDLRFLYHGLRGLDLPALRKPGRQPLISLSTIYPLLIALPPLEEQREICDLLAVADTLQEAHERVLAQLMRLRSALAASAGAGQAEPGASGGTGLNRPRGA